MPLFEYACGECSHSFETIVSSRRGEPDRCPRCNSPRVERLIALPAAGKSIEASPGTNCAGTGPPCGAPWCQRSN
jgi:putative FmdB family regulatory protein